MLVWIRDGGYLELEFSGGTEPGEAHVVTTKSSRFRVTTFEPEARITSTILPYTLEFSATLNTSGPGLFIAEFRDGNGPFVQPDAIRMDLVEGERSCLHFEDQSTGSTAVQVRGSGFVPRGRFDWSGRMESAATMPPDVDRANRLFAEVLEHVGEPVEGNPTT
jgi:hypothetical protein